MARIKLFLMRHSKSCCNHIRHDSNVQNIPLSQKIRDPALSVEGRRVATLYGPILRQRLIDAGFDIDNAIILSSKLQRAKETAALVFQKESRVIDHFTENGAIPENTPVSTGYKKPSWPAVVKQLAALTSNGDSIVVVGHGSYLGSLWPTLTGSPRKTRLNNLDGIMLDITVGPSGHFVVHGHQEIHIPKTAKAKDQGDSCGVADTRKIAALSKMPGRKQISRRNKRKSQRKSQRKNQSGGFATSMPLGFHQAGAQFAGTFAYPTGDQPVFPTEGNFIRAPLTQTQAGGFSPSVMGAFAENGARLLPMAGYMGYRMMSKQKTRKHR